MGVHHTFRPARRSRRVVDRDRLLFVLEPRIRLVCARRCEEVFVRIARCTRVLYAHHGDALEVEWLHQGLELAIDEQEPRSRVLEDVTDLLGREPRVDRDEDAAGRRYTEMGLEHG